MRREAALARGEEVTGEENFNFFMTLFYPADNLLVLDYNRVLKSLNEMTTDEFMEALNEDFEIEPLKADETSKVPARHQFSLFINDQWHRMAIRPEKIDHSTPVSRLDSSIINSLVLNKILGIEDVKRDGRVDFVGGIRGHDELVRRCQVDCKAAIAMYPCSMEELLEVADAKMIMPPKSTWFEPKPRSGFVMRCFD